MRKSLTFFVLGLIGLSSFAYGSVNKALPEYASFIPYFGTALENRTSLSQDDVSDALLALNLSSAALEKKGSSDKVDDNKIIEDVFSTLEQDPVLSKLLSEKSREKASKLGVDRFLDTTFDRLQNTLRKINGGIKDLRRKAFEQRTVSHIPSSVFIVHNHGPRGSVTDSQTDCPGDTLRHLYLKGF